MLNPRPFFHPQKKVSMASIKQYRGTTWRAIVRRTGHPTQSKTFDTKRDAERWAAAIEGKLGVVQGGTNRVNETRAATVTLFERYLIEVVPTMRGKNEPGIVKRLIRDAAFLAKPLNQLTPEMIRDWRDARVKEIKPASVHRELNTMSSVFSHAMKEWETPLAVNPCSLVSRFKGADKGRDKRWSQANIDKLLKSLNWNETNEPATGRVALGRPNGREEFVHLELEAVAFARQRLRGREHLRRGRAGLAGAALYVGDVGRDLCGA